MLKGLLGAATGSGLYLYSYDSGSARIGYYLAGMALLALAALWLGQVAFRAARAYLRTTTYLVRSKMVVRKAPAVEAAGWTPLVATTRTISLGPVAEEAPARQTVSA